MRVMMGPIGMAGQTILPGFKLNPGQPVMMALLIAITECSGLQRFPVFTIPFMHILLVRCSRNTHICLRLHPQPGCSMSM